MNNLSDINDLLGRANLETLLDMVLRDLTERPMDIARAAAAGEGIEVERSSHLLLGSARYIGAATMIDLLTSIEMAARRGVVALEPVALMVDEAAKLRADIAAWRLANPA